MPIEGISGKGGARGDDLGLRRLRDLCSTAHSAACVRLASPPHNVAIYTDQSAATKIFAEDPFGGPKEVVYDVPAIGAGSYFFRCDVHPDMKGTLEVK